MNYVDSQGRSRRIGEVIGLTLAQAKLLEPDRYDDGRLLQLSDGNWYYYNAASVLTADDFLVLQPTRSKAGRWLLAPGHPFKLALPIGFALADAAVLCTSPNTTGFLAQLGRSFWEVTADWTGGAASTIGASLSAAPHNTKGDVLGGAAGDVAATLVASGGKLLGTIGADVAGGILWKGNVAVRYDEITSAFTAGAGFVHLVGVCHANPGA
jgi:hypothetical protein